jgi:Golgi complex component 7 (COG7)
MAYGVGFEDPAFNAVAWINEVVASSAGGVTDTTHAEPDAEPDAAVRSADATDNVLAEHARALQDTSADAHAKLHTALSRALAAVPWTVREADRVRQRATALRAGVDGVGERVAGVETAVSAAVAAVAHADTLLRRVEVAADLLAQTAHADTLLDRLDALLASSAADGSDLVSAADVVAELRTTLEPLRPIPDLALRFQQLDTADKKLETLAAPRLRDALKTRNAAAASNARIVFDRAGRDNAFAAHYVSIRAAQVAEMWVAAWSGASSSPAHPTPHVMVADDKQPARGPDDSTSSSFSSTAKTSIPSSAGHSSSSSSSAFHRPEPGATDLSSTQAAIKLDAFYCNLLQFLHVESEWLSTAFPELRPRLLPALLASALVEPESPSLNDIRPFPGSLSSSGTTRLHNIAMRSVRAAADIADLLQDAAQKDIMTPSVASPISPLPSHVSNDALVAHDVVDLVLDALSALQFPCRVFWELWPAIAARTTESAALDIPLDVSTRVNPLSDIAKRVEAASGPLLESLDSLAVQVREWTLGLGVLAIPGAMATSAAVLSRRVLALIRQESSSVTRNAGVDWGRVAGALRLLNAVSSLKASWELHKESSVALSAGKVSALLEEAAVIKQRPQTRISFLSDCAKAGKWTEACVLWELVRDDSLPLRVTRIFEQIGDPSDDLKELLEHVHWLVYSSIFIGIEERLASLDGEAAWSEEILGDGRDSLSLGLSNSPLPYATDIADYLMTIPQQLEPFVPDEGNSNIYSIPSSVRSFSDGHVGGVGVLGSDHSLGGRSQSPEDAVIGTGTVASSRTETEYSAEETPRSFAGMWIGAIAHGTMELYVQKICAISRLTDGGACQLAIDIEYVCNVLAALGVVPTDKLELARQLAECNPDPVLFKEVADSLGRTDLRWMWRKIAGMRGLSLSS